jgi:formylglycine-generating enzyme required for sulfatase activity
LQGWVAARREAEQTRRRLEEQAAAWEGRGRGPGGLLDEAELPEAERWLAGPDAADLGTSPALPALVAASQQALLAARAAKRRLERRARRALAALALLSSSIALLLALIFIILPAARRAQAQGELITIPAGPALIGTNDPACEGCDREKPQQTITFTVPFAIERYEVSNRQYRLCVEDAACSAPQQPLGAQRLTDAAFSDHPVAGVRAEQAFAYCRWLGRRLPSELEWERAARGPAGRPWPWGSAPPDAARANLLYPADAKGMTQPVSSYPAGASPEGVYNLIGNVWEWTASPTTANYQNLATNVQGVWADGQPASLPTPGVLIQRGGGWKDALDRVTYRIPDNWYNATDEVGFRCAAGGAAPTWQP